MKMNFKDDGGRTLLCLEVIGKEESEGWLQSIVTFGHLGFSARFQISLMLNDIYAFYDQLVPFAKSLKGQATFLTIEDNVNLVFTSDGLGHIKIDGTLTHANDRDLRLSFTIDTDQTLLSPLLVECSQILKENINLNKQSLV